MPGDTRQGRVHEAAAERMDEVHSRGRRRVRGVVKGIPVELALLFGPAWRVRAEAAPVPAVVDVYSFAHAPAGRSYVDLADPAFQRAYAVDGAPEDLVRDLLDEATRARILALDCERLRIRRGRVEILKRSRFRFDEHREIDDALELAIDLSSRFEDLAREAEAALVRRAAHGGEPYRGGPDARAVSALTEARDDEVEAAERRTRRRWNKSRAAAGAVIGGWFLFELMTHFV